MSTHHLEILALASLTAIACALPGVFLVLRRVSLMSDAISHSILLGIVLAFFATKSLNSPWLVVGAAIVGVLTVAVTEAIIKTKRVKQDAAIGLVFPLLFSLAVILITKYVHDVDLDADCVLFGEIAFAPFNRLVINNIDLGPQGFWTIGGILFVNLIFILVNYKEMKLSTFDPNLAASLGFSPTLLNYLLMTLVSITAVVSFETVGSILVVALMIVPACVAYLLTNRLSIMLLLSGLVGMASAVGGFFLANRLDASISGSMVAFCGIIFLAVLIFAPEQGLLSRLTVRKFKKWNFAAETLSVHLLQVEQQHAEETERIIEHMGDHMLWKKDFTSEAIAQGIKEGIIRKDGDSLILTDLGREKAKNLLSKS